MPEPPTPPRSKDIKPLPRLHYTRQTGERLVIKRMHHGRRAMPELSAEPAEGNVALLMNF